RSRATAQRPGAGGVARSPRAPARTPARARRLSRVRRCAPSASPTPPCSCPSLEAFQALGKARRQTGHGLLEIEEAIRKDRNSIGELRRPLAPARAARCNYSLP